MHLQVTYIGYPNTSGLPTIDYRLTDAVTDPPDTMQQFVSQTSASKSILLTVFLLTSYVEELIRLPDCFLCYTPSPDAGPV